MMIPLLFVNISNLEVKAAPSKFHIAKDQVIDILDNGTDTIKNYTFEELVNDYVEFKEDAYDLTLGIISRNHGFKADSIEDLLNNGKIIRQYLETIDGALEDVIFTTGVWAMTGSLTEALAHLRFRYYEPEYEAVQNLISLPYREIYFPNKNGRYDSNLANFFDIYEPPVALNNLDLAMNKYVDFEIEFPKYNHYEETDEYIQVPNYLQAHNLDLGKNEISLEFDVPIREVHDQIALQIYAGDMFPREAGYDSNQAFMQLNQYDNYKIHPLEEGYEDYFPPPELLYRPLPTNNPYEIKISVTKEVDYIKIHDASWSGRSWGRLKRFHVLTETTDKSFDAVTAFSSTSTERIEPKLGEPASVDIIPIPEENKPPEEENDPSPEDGDSSWWNPLNWLWNLLKALLEKIGELIVNALNLLGDLLSGLLEGMLNVLNSILGVFSRIWDWLTWFDTDYMTDSFNTIQSNLNDKFPDFSEVIDTNQSIGTEIPDMTVNFSFMNLGNQTVMNVKPFEPYLPYLKNILRAFFYLMTVVIIYIKITGGGIND